METTFPENYPFGSRPIKQLSQNDPFETDPQNNYYKFWLEFTRLKAIADETHLPQNVHLLLKYMITIMPNPDEIIRPFLIFPQEFFTYFFLNPSRNPTDYSLDFWRDLVSYAHFALQAHHNLSSACTYLYPFFKLLQKIPLVDEGSFIVSLVLALLGEYLLHLSTFHDPRQNYSLAQFLGDLVDHLHEVFPLDDPEITICPNSEIMDGLLRFFFGLSRYLRPLTNSTNFWDPLACDVSTNIKKIKEMFQITPELIQNSYQYFNGSAPTKKQIDSLLSPEISFHPVYNFKCEIPVETSTGVPVEIIYKIILANELNQFDLPEDQEESSADPEISEQAINPEISEKFSNQEISETHSNPNPSIYSDNWNSDFDNDPHFQEMQRAIQEETNMLLQDETENEEITEETFLFWATRKLSLNKFNKTDLKKHQAGEIFAHIVNALVFSIVPDLIRILEFHPFLYPLVYEVIQYQVPIRHIEILFQALPLGIIDSPQTLNSVIKIITSLLVSDKGPIITDQLNFLESTHIIEAFNSLSSNIWLNFAHSKNGQYYQPDMMFRMEEEDLSENKIDVEEINRDGMEEEETNQNEKSGDRIEENENSRDRIEENEGKRDEMSEDDDLQPLYLSESVFADFGFKLKIEEIPPISYRYECIVLTNILQFFNLCFRFKPDFFSDRRIIYQNLFANNVPTLFRSVPFLDEIVDILIQIPDAFLFKYSFQHPTDSPFANDPLQDHSLVLYSLSAIWEQKSSCINQDALVLFTRFANCVCQPTTDFVQINDSHSISFTESELELELDTSFIPSLVHKEMLSLTPENIQTILDQSTLYDSHIPNFHDPFQKEMDAVLIWSLYHGEHDSFTKHLANIYQGINSLLKYLSQFNIVQLKAGEETYYGDRDYLDLLRSD